MKNEGVLTALLFESKHLADLKAAQQMQQAKSVLLEGFNP